VISLDVMKVTILAQTPWLMLFRMSGEEFLCLEPQTHPVNAHNMQGQPGLQVLAQGERCHFAMQIGIHGFAFHALAGARLFHLLL